MNKLRGTIRKISRYAPFNCVELRLADGCFTALTLELKKEYREGARVTVVFKESDVVLAKAAAGAVSADNRVSGTVEKLNEGAVLTEVAVAAPCGTVRALISTEAKARMRIGRGDRVDAFIQASALSLMEEAE